MTNPDSEIAREIAALGALRAKSRSPKTIRAYTESVALLDKRGGGRLP